MIRTVLGYDICEGMTPDEYEHWLFETHVPDILANPHVDKLTFAKVLRPVRRASDGSATTSEGESFYRIAEMEFADEDAYRRYQQWFDEHPVPAERGPGGKTAFRFYVVTDVTEVDRSAPLGPSFLDSAGERAE